MKHIVKKAKTSYLALIYIEDSVTHLGKAGLVNTDVTAAFARAGQGNNAGTAITLAGGTRGTWSSGGFKEKDATAMPGWYELGVPDAVLDTGSDWAVIAFKDAGVNGLAFPEKIEFNLVAYDPEDTVRFGLTALPNAAANAPGGLPISAAGGLDLDAEATTVASIQFDTTSIQGDIDNIQGRLPSSLCSGGWLRSCVYGMQPNVITDAAIASTGVTKIAGGILDDTDNLLVTDSSGRALVQSNLVRNVNRPNFEFFLTDAADHVTGKTGATPAVQVSIDGGAFGDATNTPAAEVADGVYKIDLDNDDLDGNVIVLKISAAGADTRVITLITTP